MAPPLPGINYRGCSIVHTFSDGKEIPFTENGVANDSLARYP
jgi:hypothetical protein